MLPFRACGQIQNLLYAWLHRIHGISVRIQRKSIWGRGISSDADDIHISISVIRPALTIPVLNAAPEQQLFAFV